MTDLRRGLAARTVIGFAWTSLGMGAQALVHLAALIALARLLPPNEFGVYAAAMVVAGFCAIFSEVGVGPAIVQRAELNQRHIRVAFTLSVLLSVLTATLVWAAAPAVANFFRIPELATVIRAISLAFPLQGLSMVAQALGQRELRFRWLAGIDASAFALGFLVIAPTLALLEFGIWALVGAYLTQHGARMVMLLIGQSHAKWPLFERRATVELLYFGGGFTLARVGNHIAGQGDNFVVGSWLGPYALGVYSHAYQLMAAPASVLGQVLDRVLFPAMALVQLEPQRIARGFRSGVSACALVILPISATVVVLADEIVSVLLGQAWHAVTLPLRILAVGMLFRTSYKLSDSVARATGAVYARAWRQGVFALCVVAGSWIGQHWGLGGVSLGVLAAIGVNFGLMAHLSLRLTSMSWTGFVQAHFPGAVLGALVGAGAWLLASFLRGPLVPPIVLLAAVAALAPCICAAACWIAPSFFFGKGSDSLLRQLAILMPAKFQRAKLV